MRAFFTLWRRELAAYFLSPIAYVVACCFLALMGFSFWMLVSVLMQGPGGVTVMEELFGRSIFFWLALLMTTPLLTMRLFAEERRAGTLETLLTAPVSDAAVVLAKYAGALSFFVAMWLPTALYVVALHHYSPQTTPLDPGPLLGGYLGTLLLGAFYLAVGLACSVLTRNQLVAAILCFVLLALGFFAGFTPYLARAERLRELSVYFSSVQHMLDFSRGAIDTRPIVLYLSLTAWTLFATIKLLGARSWK